MIRDTKRGLLTLARRIEAYTKLDRRYLLGGGSWLLFGQILSSLSSFILAIVFANFLPKETYGTYQYILSLASVFAIFALPGMTTALTRAVAQGFDGSVAVATATRMRWATLGAVICLGVSGYYLFAGNVSLAICLLVLAIFLPVYDTFSNFNAYLQGKKDFKRSVQYMSTIQIVTSAALIGAAIIQPNLFLLLVIYFGGYTLLRFAFYFFVARRIASQQAVDPSMVSYGKHIAAMTIIGTVSGNLDKILLFHYLGAAEVALYSVAIAPASQLKSLLILADTLIFPQFAKYSEEEIRGAMWRKFLFYGIGTVASIGIYIALVPIFFHLFFPKYVSDIFLTQIFGLSLLNFIPEPAGVYLSAKGKIKEQYYINTIVSVFQIGSIALLTATWGLIGLIIAQILTRWTGGLLNLYFYYFPFRNKNT